MSERVRIRRAAPVPVRSQIAAELEEGILDGDLVAGHRLPSVRELARRLGVHRNTVAAAYRDLERSGLAAVRPGSGVYVRRLAPPADAPAVLLRRWLRASREAGHEGASAVAARLASRLHALERWRLAVIEEEPQLRAVLVTELRRLFPVARVVGLSLAAVRRRPARLSGRVTLARPGGVDEVAALVAPWGECLPLRACIPPSVRRAVETLAAPRILAAITGSRHLRRRLQELAWRRHGEGVGFLASEPCDETGLRRVAQLAGLVLADVVSAPRLPRQLQSRCLRLHLVEPGRLPELLDMLDVRLDRGGKPRR